MLIGISNTPIITKPGRYAGCIKFFHWRFSIQSLIKQNTGTIRAIGPLVIIPKAMAAHPPSRYNSLRVATHSCISHMAVMVHAMSMVSQRTSLVIRNMPWHDASISAAIRPVTSPYRRLPSL